MSGSRRCSEDLPQRGLEVPCILHFESPKTQPPELLDKTKRLINVALSLKIELPLPSCGPDSSDHSSAAPQPSQVKIEPAHTDDDEPQLISCSMADVEQPPAKKQKYICKEFEDVIMGVELSDLQINKAPNLLKAQFPQLNGLKSTLLQNNSTGLLAVDEVKNKLQIVHCKARHHWIVTTTVKCTSGYY